MRVQLLQLVLLLLFHPHGSHAQQKGPISIVLVNDSDSTLEVIWLNQLKVVAGELTNLRTGPILPHSLERYKTYPNNALQIHRQGDNSCVDDDVGVVSQQICQSVIFHVEEEQEKDGDKTNIFLISPDFQATTVAHSNNHPSLLKAILHRKSIPATLHLHNLSGRDIDLFWVNTFDHSLVPIADDTLRANQPNLQFDNVELFHQLRVLPACDNGAGDTSCHATQLPQEWKRGYFRVTNTEIEVTVTTDFDLIVEEKQQQPQNNDAKKENNNQFVYQPGIDLYQQCHDHFVPQLQKTESSPELMVQSIQDCITQNFDKVQEWPTRRPPRLQTYLDFKLEGFICDQDAMATTQPIETHSWQDRAVQVLHETPSSQIHVISNFVTSQECAAMGDAANANRWERTKLPNGKPNPIRKAHQARVDIPWPEDYYYPDHDGNNNINGSNECTDCATTNDTLQHNNHTHLLRQTGQRIFDYVHHVHPQLDISPLGQEPLMAIRYQGNNNNNNGDNTVAVTTAPDAYKSHCDTDCNGQPIAEGNRVATMVLYCTLGGPQKQKLKGGHTHFRKAHVHVAPQPGMALFFSYVNETTMTADAGNTIHSGCPVYEGTKQIVTQWIRYGVDQDHPYTDYARW